MALGTESNDRQVSARVLTVGLDTDVGYVKDGNQPIKKYAGRVSAEHVLRQPLQACIPQIGSI